MTADAAAVAALDRPELSALWASARQRLERNGRTVTAVGLRLGVLSDAEVDGICQLLGRRRPATNEVKVSLAQLDAMLRSSAVGDGVVATIEALSGPIRDRRRERATEQAVRDDLWDAVAAHPVTSDPQVQAWLESVRRRGTLTRLGVTDPEVMAQVLDAVEWLRASRDARRRGPLPLSMIAAVQLGDGHALDPDTAVGSLLLDALRSVSGKSDARSAWAAFGVQLDRVSASVLTLMLPGVAESLTGAAAATAEPLRVTHRMLDLGFGLDLDGLRRVWVCENPAILSLAADRLGTACAPIVCLDGMPSTPASRLLGLLRDAGVEVAVHTDLDAGGVAIASYVIDRFGAVPWRMGAVDYLDAIAGPTTPIGQTIGATPWDPELAAAMNEHGVGVHEEAIFDTLLSDLSRSDR